MDCRNSFGGMQGRRMYFSSSFVHRGSLLIKDNKALSCSKECFVLIYKFCTESLRVWSEVFVQFTSQLNL
jgi:hypothetical protein